MTTVPLTATVSLMQNNLAVSANGWCAAVHNSVSTGGGKLLLTNVLAAGSSKDGPEVSQVTSIRYLPLAAGPVLAVCASNGTQIYSEDATTLLCYVPINDAAAGETVKQHQGCCLVPSLQHVVIGTWKGGLALVAAAAGLSQLADSAPSAAASPVVDVCFNEVSGTVVSAHTGGELGVWTLSDAGPYTNANLVGAVGEAPVRIAALSQRLIVAYALGTVCLFDAITMEVQAELTAHARCITSLDVREDLGWVITAGEDTVMNVWQVDAETGRVGVQHSSVVTDKLLAGAALFGSEVLVSAYDAGELYRVAL